MKKFIAGVLAGITLATGVTAFASTEQTITAVFDKVKLFVDGSQVQKETLLYNGTTYVPLRAAAEALGKEVSYDAETYTAYIGTAPIKSQGSKASESNVQTTKYMWSNSLLKSYHYAALAVKNTGNETVNISVEFHLKDNAKNIVGVKSDDARGVAPNQEVLLYTMDDSNFTDFDFKITTNTSDYKSIMNGIDFTSNVMGDKIILSASNSGSKDMDFVKATVIYFSNGKPIDIDFTYLVNDNSVLAPGTTEYGEIKTYGTEFDDYKIYLTGTID